MKMDRKALTLPFEFKANGDSGEFSGYAAYYGNVDSYDDIIEPGAFKAFRTTKEGRVRVHYNHNIDKVMGSATLRDDGKGLVAEGRLNAKVSYVRDVMELMKSGDIDEMSFAYDILDGGSNVDDKNIRHLTGLKVYEVSIVSIGANDKAQIFDIKQVCNPRGFEKLLRDCGASRSDAVKATSQVFGKSDSCPDTDTLGELAASVQLQAAVQMARLNLA